MHVTFNRGKENIQNIHNEESLNLHAKHDFAKINWLFSFIF